MTFKELKKQVLELSISDRWSLVQTLLESLKQESKARSKKRNLSRLRGIAQPAIGQENFQPRQE